MASLEVEKLDISENAIGNAIDYFTRDYKELYLICCKISSITKIGNIGLLVLHKNYLTDVSYIATKQIARLTLSHNRLTSCVLPKVYMVLDLEGNDIPRSDIDKCTARWFATKYGMISTYPNKMNMILAPYFPAVLADIIINVPCCEYCLTTVG